MLLTLSVGVAAFGVNIIINAKNPLETGARNWLLTGLGVLFGATLAAIFILYSRIEDYRQTISGVAMMRDNPGFVTDQAVIDKAKKVKKTERRLNRLTNILLYVLPVWFFAGFVCITATVLVEHWMIMFPAKK